MNKGLCAIFLWILCSFNALAGSDPVSWQLTPASGFPATKVGEQSIVYYTFTNRLPFATRLVLSSKITGSSFIFHDECHNKLLYPGKQCTVVVTFKPASTKPATFQLDYLYDKKRIPLPALSAKGISQPSTRLSGTIVGLPTAFYQKTTVDFTAVYSNTGTRTLTGCTFSNFSHSGVAVSNLTSAPGIPHCGSSLAPGASCKVDGRVTSGLATGVLTISATGSCSGPSLVKITPKASSLIKAPASMCVVHASMDLPLPNNTYKYADNVVRFRFENECPTAIALGPVSIAADGGLATITRAPYSAASNSLNNCGSTLAAGAECVVTASVIPNSIGNLTVAASVSPPGKSVAIVKTATTVASNIQATHHILFVNQCKFPVWYGIANGGDVNCPGQQCATRDPNLKANPAGAPASAYYLPAQTNGLAPSTIDLSVSSYTNGALWPRTGCSMQNGQFNCVTGTCQTKTNSATCLSPADNESGPVQPQSPFTKIEGYISSTPGGDGVYDVSVINGMTVPVEMKAFGPPTGNTASTVYNCSAAGALIQPASNKALGNCSWNFNPQSTIPISGINSDFYWVTPGDDDGCPNGINCGMSYSSYPQSNGNSPGPVNRRKGSFLGFNPLLNDSAYIIPTQWGSRNLFTQYGMGIQIPGQTSSNNYGTSLVDGTPIVLSGNTYPAYNVLLSIPGITNNGSLNSCYQVANSFFAHCGGCINWTNTLPANPCGYGSPNYHANWNLDWTTNLIHAPIGNYTPLQAIAWLKNACPTAYSYQFDDQASSFQCNKDGAANLLTSYQITFCPGGVDSLPAGATEGRSLAP